MHVEESRVDTARVLETFLEAVRIDSPSGEEGRFATWCAERLGALGCTVRFDDSRSRTGSDTGNLIAELPSTDAGMTIVFSAHMDTVEPGRGIRPVVRDGVVYSEGETILGSDDKAGIAGIIEVLTVLHDGSLPHGPVRILLTTGEELGLQGAKALEEAECTGDLCLVLDAHGPVGGIVTAAPTHHTFRAIFRGVAAHAGVEPEKGISALVMAANAVSAMRIGRLDEATTANVGEIKGGRATNVVTAECLLTGECRSLDPAKAEAVRLEMDGAMRTAAASLGGTVELSWTKEYDGFRFDESDPLLVLVEGACRDIGAEPLRFSTGGGSDGNVLSGKGLKTLVMACGMSEVHGTSEHVAVSDLGALARLLLAVLDRAVA
jgi:tripeptide aminopeptidase